VGGERGGSGLHQFSCIGKKLMKFKEGHSEEGMVGGGFPRAVARQCDGMACSVSDQL
jgi:hypothetical protein